MKTFAARFSRLAPVALAALFVLLLLPVAGTQAPVVHATPAASASATAPVASVVPIVGWTGPSALRTTVSNGPTCDDAYCLQVCQDQGWPYGVCRGNRCACGI